jgi:hypothetical protein
MTPSPGLPIPEARAALAIPMRMRRDGLPLTLRRAELAAAIPHAGSRVLVLVHGLCTNDLQWRRHGHDHGTALARDTTHLDLLARVKVYAQLLKWLT